MDTLNHEQIEAALADRGEVRTACGLISARGAHDEHA